MTSIIYQFRLYCNTENIYKTVWNKSSPSICPSDDKHSIDQNSIVIIDQKLDDVTSSSQETLKTGRNFKLDKFKIFATKNSVTTNNFTFPFPINIMNFNITTNQEHIADKLTIQTFPSVVGVLTSSTSSSSLWQSQNYIVNNLVRYKGIDDDRFGLHKCIVNTVSSENPSNTAYWEKQTTTINVSKNAISSVQIGYNIVLDDNVHSDDIGYVILINNDNNTIVVSGTPTNDYSTSPTTNIKTSMVIFDNIELCYPLNYAIKQSTTNGIYIDKNTTIQTTYKNKSVDNDKYLIIYIEYLH